MEVLLEQLAALRQLRQAGGLEPTEEQPLWELAADAQDVEDAGTFAKTVLHEYCHYLTLNNKQAGYGGQPDPGCYAESDLAARLSSYLNAFYRPSGGAAWMTGWRAGQLRRLPPPRR